MFLVLFVVSFRVNVGRSDFPEKKPFFWILGFAGLPSCEVGDLRRGSGANQLTVRSVGQQKTFESILLLLLLLLWGIKKASRVIRADEGKGRRIEGCVKG